MTSEAGPTGRPMRAARLAPLEAELERRILVLDGAMGTEIQKLALDEAAFRGARFKDWHRDLRGNNDLLNLTRPGAIEAIHDAYLAAGADIIETNTFNSTRIALADYGLEEFARELNETGARRSEERRVGKECRSRWAREH